jgi:hypothetical protein
MSARGIMDRLRLCEGAAARRRPPSSPFSTVTLNDRWRVTSDGLLQWILWARQAKPRSKASGYVARRFHCWRGPLIEAIRRFCGDIDPAALKIIGTWPERHPDFREGRDASR